MSKVYEGEMKAVLKKINPKELYPLAKIEFINPNSLCDTTKKYTTREIDTPIKAIEYEGYYFIYEGSCEVIAACLNKMQSVEIELVDRSQIPFWNNDKNLVEQLASIGMNAIYDFEAIAGFKYEEYPRWYQG